MDLMLSPGHLFDSLLHSIKRHDESALYMSGTNPYMLLVNGRRIVVYVSQVHTTSRGHEDEIRIQCSGGMLRCLISESNRGAAVAVLGYDTAADVYTAWDPARYLDRNATVNRFSLYTRLSTVSSAMQSGFARYLDSNQQSVLSFQSEFLGFYLCYPELLHQASDESLQRIVRGFGGTSTGAGSGKQITIAKKRVKLTHIQFARTPQFRKLVLSSYGSQCAVCELQLGLIEAAHIVPHSHPEANEAVTNGLALCPLHHRSFDSGLVLVHEDYSIQVNDARVDHLTELNRIGGLRAFKKGLRRDLALPEAAADYPLAANICLGKQVRGIGVH